MSADNYVYVDSVGGGRFAVWDCFASDDDPLHKNKPVATFPTLEEAILAAHTRAQDGYYEYGVIVGPKVPA